MTYNEAIRGRIKQLCKSCGINIYQLALLSGVPHSTVSNIVRGVTESTGTPTMNLIAKGFGMTLSEFFDFPEINDLQLQDDE